MTVMGDALMDGLSDAGSIPARSTKKQRVSTLCFFMLSDILLHSAKLILRF